MSAPYSDFPAIDGRTVQQGHASYCEDHGHASYVIDGEAAPHCPRCGDYLGTTPTEDRDIAQVLVDAAIVGGGASIWQGEEADHGYLVGIDGRGITTTLNSASMALAQRNALITSVASWVARTRSVDVAATWGSWLDSETRVAYFDVSSHHGNLSNAHHVAANRGELAIWDVANGREIRTDHRFL